MVAFRRSRAFLPAVLVVVGVLIGFLAMQARGSDDNDDGRVAATEKKTNCSPIARADAAATRPAETVLIDVLANDTDSDGDQLVFQILTTQGGTSEIDDADTPTDSADDRLAFTPTSPPAETATIEYQALDPQGGFGTSTVTVAINPNAVLPDGVRSALATDPAVDGTSETGCEAPPETTTTSIDPLLTETTSTTVFVEDETAGDDSSTVTTSGRRTGTTRGSGTAPRRTTTTAKKPSSGGTTNTTAGRPGTTAYQPPTTDASDVDPPSGGGGPATTQPQSPPSSQPQSNHPCAPPNQNSQACQDWKDAQRS